MSELIDVVEKGLSRLATQYKRSTNMVDFITIVLEEIQELEQANIDALTLRDIDTATDAQLDVVGKLVGQPRELIDVGDLVFFALEGYPNAGGLGDLNNSSLGARLASLGEPLAGFRTLDNEEYRLFIKARIAKNNTNSTVQEIIDAVKFITGAPLVLITEGYVQYSVNIGADLTPNDEALLKTSGLVPKTAGVTVDYAEIDPNSYFALEGVTGAEGLGDLNDPSIGGKLGSILGGSQSLSPVYSQNFVRFTEADPDYLLRSGNLGVVSPTNGFTLSFWIDFDAVLGAQTLFTCHDDDSGNNIINVRKGGGPGEIQVTVRQSDGTVIAQLSGNPVSVDTLYHVLIAYDVVDGLTLYVNDGLIASDVGIGSTVELDVIDVVSIMASQTGGLPTDARLSDFWFDDQYFDITLEANRRRFIDDQGAPVNPGGGGQFVAGNTPLIFFGNGQIADDWNDGDNRGTGGAFVMTGSVTDV